MGRFFVKGLYFRLRYPKGELKRDPRLLDYWTEVEGQILVDRSRFWGWSTRVDLRTKEPRMEPHELSQAQMDLAVAAEQYDLALDAVDAAQRYETFSRAVWRKALRRVTTLEAEVPA